MYCQQVLTYLSSPVKSLTFCQNSLTCYYFLPKKTEFPFLVFPYFRVMPTAPPPTVCHCMILKNIFEARPGRGFLTVNLPKWLTTSWWRLKEMSCPTVKQRHKHQTRDCMSMVVGEKGWNAFLLQNWAPRQRYFSRLQPITRYRLRSHDTETRSDTLNGNFVDFVSHSNLITRLLKIDLIQLCDKIPTAA